MPDHTDLLRQRAQAIMPDLKIEQVERNQEGLINDVLIVNKTFVFRFARTEDYARILEAEMRILDLIRPQLDISVPTPVYRSFGCMVYPLLSGEALSRKMVMAFDESTQNQVAEQVGTFLYRLHTTDISKVDWELPASRAPVKREDWLEIQAEVKQKIYPLLQKYQIEWADDLFNSVLENPESANYEPALIHGDLASYHFLFDGQERKITGVIDFGMAGMGDAASDIGNLINIYGESFVKRIGKAYPNLEKYISRARFYSQLIELEWILRGMETGEAFWFTAHLAGARDLQS